MNGHTLAKIAHLCGPAGINLICRPLYGGIGTILMFHRLTNAPETRVDLAGVVDAAYFDRLVAAIRQSGTAIVRLADVPRALAEKKRFVCLTFDDGYRDNLEIALPILRKHHAPATIFVPSGVLDRTLDPWWLQVEQFARGTDTPQATYAQMVCKMESHCDAFERVRASLTSDPRTLVEAYFLSADEIRQIARDPLVDIGGHTISHRRLRDLSDEDAWREIRQNRRDLEDVTGQPVETFAYPYGNETACGAREYALARKAGYTVAVTTRDGNIFPGHRHHLLSLPRYAVRGDFENLAIFRMQSSGAYHALRSRFGRPLVTG
ncbi:MAG: hypothetical protein EOM26_07750 [Alphaproteobacteria bacterium]|nr:hypothetical protein [Alphaproteobacteria bacterium]